MIEDEDVTLALVDVEPLSDHLPQYAGTWAEPPFASPVDQPHLAILAVGDHSWDLLLDRTTGTLYGQPEDEPRFVVNSSLERFVSCIQAAEQAVAERNRLEDDDDLDPDEADEQIEEIGERLTARLSAIDPVALEDENAFWAVLAEELGYGM